MRNYAKFNDIANLLSEFCEGVMARRGDVEDCFFQKVKKQAAEQGDFPQKQAYCVGMISAIHRKARGSNMHQVIEEHDVEAMACGAKYLGSGGGGDHLLMELLTKRAIREHGPVRLVSPFAYGEEKWVVSIAVMGSPTILSEKIMTGREPLEAVRRLESMMGQSFDALIGLEIGGMNVLTPLLAAAMSQMPVVDSDGMGRAFPELQMTTFHATGVPASPCAMVHADGKYELIREPSNWHVEKKARQHVTDMGGWAAIASYPMQVRQIREAGLHQTFSLAKRLGEAVLAAGRNVERVMDALSGCFENSIYGKPVKLIEGKVVHLEQNNLDGLLSGDLVVEGTGFHVGEQVSVFFRNEYLYAKRGEQMAAMVPDLICVLDDTGQPVMVEELENHRKVWVIAIPSPLMLRTAKMLEVAGPQTFGLAEPFLSVEQLAAGWMGGER